MTTTVTTTTANILIIVASGLSLFVILTLLAVLLVKQRVNASDETRMLRLRRVLNIAMIPLLISFVLIALATVMEVLAR